MIFNLDRFASSPSCGECCRVVGPFSPVGIEADGAPVSTDIRNTRSIQPPAASGPLARLSGTVSVSSAISRINRMKVLCTGATTIQRFCQAINKHLLCVPIPKRITAGLGTCSQTQGIHYHDRRPGLVRPSGLQSAELENQAGRRTQFTENKGYRLMQNKAFEGT